MTPLRWTVIVRAAAVATVAGRLARGLTARAPLARSAGPLVPVTVVVPARDEANRIGPLLTALSGARGVESVIVVDDRSTDRTGAIAGAAGAEVIAGTEPPIGWTGKTWALAQGVEAAETEWVVILDADVVPAADLPSAAVARAIIDRLDLLTLAGRAELPAGTGRWLHAALLSQIVYRFGPPGSSRRLANGQCMVARRAVLLGGLRAVSREMVEDVALARHLGAAGHRVDFLDATDLLLVRPYGSAGEVWSGWGRSIGLRGVEPWPRQVCELGLLAAVLVVPPLRVARRTADAIDLAAAMMRFGTLVGTRRAYVGRGASYWSSPLADPLAIAATVSGLVTPSPTWRGRRVGRPATRSRIGVRRRSSARR